MWPFNAKAKVQQQIDAVREELRAEFRNTAISWHDADSGLWQAFGVDPSAAGVSVTPESARRATAVYACVNLIAGTIASTPVPVYQRTATGRERVEHDVWWMLNEQPCPGMTAASFWEWMVSSILLRGDGIAEIVRVSKGSNAVRELAPLPREKVVISKQPDGRLAYTTDEGGKKRAIIQEDVLHFPGFGFDGISGESVIKSAARQAVGTALAADQFSGSFFQRGATPSVVIEYPEGVAPKQEQANFLREQFEEKYAGLGNANRPLVLVNGGKLSRVTMSPQDSQLLETRKFQVIDIARAFGVPPILIGEGEKTSSWGAGVEQILRAFLTFTLNPRLVLMEQELNRKLWPKRERYFTEFNRNGWLEGDNKAQGEFFKTALGGPGAQGWMTVNEVRRLKNLPPVKGGDDIIKAGATNETPDSTGDSEQRGEAGAAEDSQR